MNAEPGGKRPRAREALYLGSIITAAITLIPGINGFAFIGMILGPLAAVWLANRKLAPKLTLNEGADIGFRSTFYGLLLAGTIYDAIWHVFGYRLWRVENLDRLFRWVVEMMHDTLSPGAWVVITFQIIVIAIGAAIFGVPAGMAGAAILGRKTPRD
jgi:hypothetical protein